MKMIHQLFQIALIVSLFMTSLSAQNLTICIQDTDGNPVDEANFIFPEKTPFNTTPVNFSFQIINDCRVYDISSWPMGDYGLDTDSNISLSEITTFDLVLLHRHILGIDLLDSPLKLIAADLNRSEAVTTIDLVLLRRLILNIDTELFGATNVLIQANHNFPDPTNPWTEPNIFQLIDIFTLPTNEDILINAIKVKIGNLN